MKKKHPELTTSLEPSELTEFRLFPKEKSISSAIFSQFQKNIRPSYQTQPLPPSSMPSSIGSKLPSSTLANIEEMPTSWQNPSSINIDHRTKNPHLWPLVHSFSWEDATKFDGTLGTFSLFHERLQNVLKIGDFNSFQITELIVKMLRGRPLRLAQSMISIGGYDYQKIIDVLRRRFNQETKGIEIYANLINDLDPINSDCVESLRNLCDIALSISIQLNDKDDVTAELLKTQIRGKFDDRLFDRWEEYLSKKKKISDSFKFLVEFLEKELEKAETLDKMLLSKSKGSKKDKPTEYCIICNEPHYLGNCKKFLLKTVSERKAIVASDRRCINCLKSGHRVADCKSRCCKICEEKHHRALHEY